VIVYAHLMNEASGESRRNITTQPLADIVGQKPISLLEMRPSEA